MSFTWVPIYNEMARRILEFEHRQHELLDLLGKMAQEGMKVVKLTDKDAAGKEVPLTEIDPITFFASFNRSTVTGNRQAMLTRIKEAWQLSASVPQDFDGIPIFNPQNSWCFRYLADREATDIPTLWRVARVGVDKDWRTFDPALFDQALNLSYVALAKLTIGLFWLHPQGYLPCDQHTQAYLLHRGVALEGETAAAYFDWVGRAVETAGNDFPQLSFNAYRPPEQVSGERRYWWLNANPKIWDFRAGPVGSVQTYTAHNEAGHKRQKFKHFAAVQPGDLMIGYIASPDKEIVALCEVTKALHGDPPKDCIEFKKIEQFAYPVTWAELQSVPALAECEPVQNNQGSLFSVAPEEFETIRFMLDERNLDPETAKSAPFTIDHALDGLFLSKGELTTILDRLKRKKALILQGPPGVGKTFIARRLAFALMEERDERRLTMVQFHPSYGYEDFVQGFRPTRTGLERRDGVFHQFVRQARNDPQRDWFFIIDEINRGNLAKIFGELLMLIEADKRGPSHAIPLTYSDGPEETFYLPENIHLIGTMNTADRSLAMVDYALRRRFAFVSLDPKFDSPAFAEWLENRKTPAPLIQKIVTRIGDLNRKIEKERDLGAGFRVGHSFFCPPDGYLADEAWYHEIITGEVQPLLEEYFDSADLVQKLVTDLLAP